MTSAENILIRSMRETDLDFAAACTANEGWVSEDRSVIENFFAYDPRGCLVAEMDGQPVGICIATPYAATGFIGELIVAPAARGYGVGAELLYHGVNYLLANGIETVYLDGVLKAIPLYERNGFRKVCRSWRFLGRPGDFPGQEHPGVRPMRPDDLDTVCFLDKRLWGEDRGFFLRRRYARFPELGRVLEAGGRVAGYILGRRGDGWVSAGPWLAAPGVERPERLFEALAVQARGCVISVGVLDANAAARDLLLGWGFVAREDSPWRMANGTGESLGASKWCYAVGSAAKG